MTMVEGMWVCVVLSLAGAAAGPLSEELFYRAPRLFHMEDYAHCLFRNGTYCMGDFEVSPEEEGIQLYQEMMEVTADRYHYNRSKLHRGICISSCDVDEEGPALPAARFERCVDNEMQQYGLRARLEKLNYCRSKEEPGTRERDFSDYLLAAVVGLLVLSNAVGTLYDFKRDPCAKANKFLMAWSVRNNWQRVTTVFSGDQKLDALAPIHGIKAHMIVIVVLAHAVFALVMVYPHDERTVEEITTAVKSNICMNGTIVVQTFTMLSSFLLGYTVLTNFENAKRAPSIKYWPAIAFNRYTRIVPSTMLVVGLTATWTARLANGPMWHLVEEMEGACRNKWWAQLLFINNIYAPDDRCLVQSWFFAVEMQLFLCAIALTLYLAARPRYALRILSTVYVATVAVNFALNISWKMVPVVTFATPDNLRTMATGVDSYIWMFQATWTSAPACLHGLMLAFINHNLEKKGLKPEKHKWLGKCSWVVLGCMAAWLMSGALVKQVADPLWLAVYASLDRILFNAMVTFLTFAYINGHGGWVLRYLSWGGFQIMSRMVLPTMLVHWHVNLLGLAASPQPAQITLYQILVNWVVGTVLSLMLALPLHLLVELPTQKMLS